MKFIIDSHIHVYPCYDLERAFSTLLSRMDGVAPDAVNVACLTERYDCDFFDELSADSTPLDDRFSVRDDPNETCLWIQRKDGGGSVALLPGRQVVSSENIEVIALAHRQRIADGLPAAQIVETVLKNDGVPMLSWSPGKWWFGRGNVVTSLLDRFSPAHMVIGDTGLRPLGWGTPWLMRKARNRGFRVLAGSDPLPVIGEERYFGTYMTAAETATASASPTALIHSIVRDSSVSLSVRGSRPMPFAIAQRLRKNSAAKTQR
ncbi:MAG: hypothetical protein OEQ39_05240 [Gammaproteobacteria bacterium]|nr:hypothetical protein [Gammaproteobacteria bacterium]MDH3465231.1 hypothetical protein [Gammaproteobacteria bacterium]